MSRRSRGAYYAAVDRPIAWCDNAFTGLRCGNQGARIQDDGLP